MTSLDPRPLPPLRPLPAPRKPRGPSYEQIIHQGLALLALIFCAAVVAMVWG